MVVYEVNIEVSDSILDAYSLWPKEHVEEILKLPGFVKANTFREDKKFCVHYWPNFPKDLENYMDNHAALMRQKGEDLFKGQFSATRRILTLEEKL